MNRLQRRLRTLPGTPRRVRTSEEKEPFEKVAFDVAELEDVLPVSVRIEVGGGRSSTASAMRAAKVQQELEQVGAAARTVELEGQHAALEAEADGVQVLHVARLPFVRRISRS